MANTFQITTENIPLFQYKGDQAKPFGVKYVVVYAPNPQTLDSLHSVYAVEWDHTEGKSNNHTKLDTNGFIIEQER